MNYMGDVEFWNTKFAHRERKIMQHEKCLEADIDIIKSKSTILDVACGDGRNAIYLAKLGFDVEAIDFSEEAIQRLNFFAEKENISVSTAVVDFSTDGLGDLEKTYDVVIINHYRFPPEKYFDLIQHLNAGGILWANGFGKIPINNPNIREEDLLKDKDFELLINCELLDKKRYEWNGNSFVRYIWKKGDDGEKLICKM